MDIAIVTGASSSLGLAISRRLIQLGFRVYGLGGDYKDCPLQNVNFRPVACNLADPDAVESAAKRILEKEKGVLVLVNNAKYFGSKNYLEMTPEEMQRVMNINLLCPLILARTFAEGLINLQGYIIQLGPLHVESSHGGPAGAATAGGLKWMSELLFHDLREYGVKVCHLSPEPNRGRDPRTAPRQGTKVTASIDPEAVAQALEQLLQSNYGNIVTEMVIRPLRIHEPEHDPVFKLPYPKPKPVPYTVPRELIEAEDQLEEEEYKKKQELRRSRRKESSTKATKKVARKTTRGKSDGKAEAKEEAKPETKAETKPKAKDRTDDSGEKKPRRKSRPEKPRKENPNRRKPDTTKVEEPKDEPKDETPPPAPEPRRRSRRKPRPPRVEVGFHKEDKKDVAVEKKPKPEKSDPAEKHENPEKSKEKTGEKNVKTKKATRKTARKTATKKAATRKTTARKTTAKNPSDKPAEEKPKKSTATKKVPRKRVAKKKLSDEKSD